MRPSRKGLESEEADISRWETLHQTKAAAPEHLDWKGPSLRSRSTQKCHLVFTEQL